MFRKIWDSILGFLNEPIYKHTEMYESVDDNQAELTSDEALKIALPIAIENGWVYETKDVTLGNEPPSLAKDNRINRIVWIISFGFLVVQGEIVDKRLNKNIGTIIVDDKTGEILEIRK